MLAGHEFYWDHASYTVPESRQEVCPCHRLYEASFTDQLFEARTMTENSFHRLNPRLTPKNSLIRQGMPPSLYDMAT